MYFYYDVALLEKYFAFRLLQSLLYKVCAACPATLEQNQPQPLTPVCVSMVTGDQLVTRHVQEGPKTLALALLPANSRQEVALAPSTDKELPAWPAQLDGFTKTAIFQSYTLL